MILTGFRKEQFWSISWIFESLAMLCIVLADSWFALVVLTGLVEQLWISALFLPVHYLVISAGLLWFIKFLILEDNKDSTRLAKQGSRSSSRQSSSSSSSTPSTPIPSAHTTSSTGNRRRIIVGSNCWSCIFSSTNSNNLLFVQQFSIPYHFIFIRSQYHNRLQMRLLSSQIGL